MIIQVAYFITALVFIFFLPGSSPKIQIDLLIKNVNIIDVQNGKIRNSVDILINSDRIKSIQTHNKKRGYLAKQIVDGSGQYLIPGLWDMHTLTWNYHDFFPLLIANGVTGIRGMSGNLEHVKRIRQRIKERKMTGPEIISSGEIIDGKSSQNQGPFIFETADQGRAIVKKQKEEGADFIKVYNSLNRETYFAIAEECRRLKIPFGGHIPYRISLKEAVKAGHLSIEHFWGILEFCSSQEDYYMSVMRGERIDTTLVTAAGRVSHFKHINYLIKTFDEKKIDELITLLSKSNSWICPTNIAMRSWAFFDDQNYRNDDRIYYLPQYATSHWGLSRHRILKDWTTNDFLIAKDFYKLVPSYFKKMLDGGVRFLAGTDYPWPFTFPGFGLHDELEIFVRFVFSPLEALQTATLNPAIFLKKLNDFGTIEAGKVANLILLSENPLSDIRNTKKISWVVLRGRAYEGKILRAELDSSAAKNKLPQIMNEINPLLQEKGLNIAINHYRLLKTTRPKDYNFDEFQLIQIGQNLIYQKRFVDAIEILKLNLETYSQSGDTYDVLGDAYLENGDTENALAAYKKAMEMGMNEVSGPKIDSLNKRKMKH